MTTQETHELLRRALAIRTINGENNERVLAEFLRGYFSGYGIPSVVEDGNIKAVVPGSDTAHRIVLNGHLDTVPYGDVSLWNSDPAQPVEKDGRVYARGASDMKSGLCAMVAALCSIVEKNKRPRRTVVFLGTADEEKDGAGANLAASQKICEGAELLLIAEPTGGAVGISQKGCLWLQCTVRGRASHGAYPWEGINAVTAGFEFAENLRKYVELFIDPLFGNSTLSCNMISGGTANNIVPDRCVLTLDIRMVSLLSEDKILECASGIAECMKLSGKVLAIDFEVLNYRKSIRVQPDNAEAARLRASIETITDFQYPDIGINFFTDASVLVKDLPGIPVILYGPGNPDTAHKANEYVEFAKYDEAVQVYEDFLLK